MTDNAALRPASRAPLWIAISLGFIVTMFAWPAGLFAFLPLVFIGWFVSSSFNRYDSAVRALQARDTELEQRVMGLERHVAALRAPPAAAAATAPPPVAPAATPTMRAADAALEAALDRATAEAEVAATVKVPQPTPELWQPTQPLHPSAGGPHPNPPPRSGGGSGAAASPAPFGRPMGGAPAGPREPSPFDRAIEGARAWLLGGNTVARIGLLILFVGVAFLLRYVAEHTRIPIEVRLLGVAALGLGFLAAGWRLRDRKPGFAITLQGGAIGILYLTAFAALRLYGVLPPLAAFAFMAVLAAMSGLLAILQNARALAALGATGGFLAPLLISTGEGRVAMLFSYYLLLNLGVLGIAWFRAWRELNWIAFVATFGVSGIWAVRRYAPEDFLIGQGFLIAFWLLFLVVSVLYALRQTDRKRGIFDTTLVFALPLAAFGIQTRFTQGVELALASTVGAAVYLALSFWLQQRRDAAFQLLTEACFALGVGFLTLAVPLAASAQWTAAAWALEGLALVWVGQRQGRIVALAAGALLHGLAAFALFKAYAQGDVSVAAQWSGLTVNFAVLAACAFLSSRFFAASRIESATAHSAVGVAAWLARAAAWTWAALLVWQPLAFPWYVFGWYLLAVVLIALERPDPAARLATPEWVMGLVVIAAGAFAGEAHRPGEITHTMQLLLRLALAATAVTVSLMSLRSANVVRRTAAGVLLTVGVLAWLAAALAEAGTRIHDPLALAQVALVLIGATALALTALGTRLAWDWPVRLAWAFFAAHVVLAAYAIVRAVLEAKLPSHGFGWIVWPLAWAAFYWRLGQERRLTVKLPVADAVHVAGLWLLTGMVAAEVAIGVDRFAGDGWFHAAWAAAIAAALWWTVQAADKWPVRWAPAIHANIGKPGLAVAGGLWLLLVNAASGGDPAPLPKLPLVNPMDLASLGVLAALVRWHIGPDPVARLPVVRNAIAAAGFLVLNVMALRAVHFVTGVAWNPAALGRSLVVQAVLSLLWTGTAMALMLFAHRRAQRPVWIAGALLLAVVVAKLFVVDLSGQGTIERIVSFVGVGLLILLIGYLAPVPPASAAGATREAS